MTTIILRRCPGLGAAMVAATLVGPAQGQPAARESDIKAAYLFNFSQFVEWPTNAFARTNAPFVIGILGDDPFGRFLDELVKNERAQGRSIVLQRFDRVKEASHAQLLFISTSERSRMNSILDNLRGKPILIVGEGGDRSFLQRGGIIELVTETNRVRIRINLDAAKSAQLTVSTKLLRIADVMPTETP